MHPKLCNANAWSGVKASGSSFSRSYAVEGALTYAPIAEYYSSVDVNIVRKFTLWLLGQ